MTEQFNNSGEVKFSVTEGYEGQLPSFTTSVLGEIVGGTGVFQITQEKSIHNEDDSRE